MTTTVGTTYDGRTPRLRAQTAVVPSSTIDLYFSIQDLGDSSWDSAVFLDKFFWSENPTCEEGATVDTDGDGLLDIWETEGLTVTVGGVTEFVNLPAMGANPKRKDIFIEIDYMQETITHTHKPSPEAIAIVVDAFKNAPVSNEDGSTGVQLHVDYGKDAPLTYGTATAGGSTPTWGALSNSDALTHTTHLGTDVGTNGYSWAEFKAIKKAHFTPGRAAVFHYNLWIHQMSPNLGGTSGMAFVPGSDFIVSLGTWTNNVGSPLEQAGTFMHELGHNLGLSHGGKDDVQWKPNHLSIMNYSFQTNGLIKNSTQKTIDYSRFDLAELHENSLNEQTNIFTPTKVLSNTYGTLWFCGLDQTKLANDASQGDWNCNNTITDTVVSANINQGRSWNNNSTLDVLKTINEWLNLVYTGGAIGQPGATIEIPDVTEVTEITKEQADEIPALYPEILTTTPQTVQNWTQQSSAAAHSIVIWSVAWAPTGNQYASGSDDGTVKIWDTSTGTNAATLEGHIGAVFGIGWSPDGAQLASASADATIRIWDLATGAAVQILEGHTGAVRAVAWSPDGTQLASASADGTIQLWDTATWTSIRSFNGHTNEVNAVAWSPDGTQLATGSDDNTVRVWTAATGEARVTFTGHTERVWSVAWSPDGTRLASGSEDDTVRIWDMNFDTLLTTLTGLPDGVRSVAWSPDGKQLATGEMDTTVRIWDVATESLATTLTEHVDYVNSVAWSPSGTMLLTGAGDGTLATWSREAFQERPQWSTRSALGSTGVALLSIAWSPIGPRILSGAGNGAVRIWNIETEELLSILNEHREGVRAVAWSPDGTKVASASYDGTVRVWDATTGANLALLEGHTAGVTSVAWSPDGTRLASGAGTGDSTVRIWDAVSGAVVGTLRGHAEEVTGVAWSPDGTSIATASLDKSVRVWDVATTKEVAQFVGHRDSVSSVAWSPDGKWLASGSNDKTVMLWDRTQSDAAVTLSGHTDTVSSVAWSPDGRQIASASADNTLKVWDIATNAELVTLTGHTAGVRGVTWSPDSKLLASVSNDGVLRIWNAVAERTPIAATTTSDAPPVMEEAFCQSPQNLRSALVGQWYFPDGVQDGTGNWQDLQLNGAVQSVDGLTTSSNGWAETKPADGKSFSITEKTLVAWVKFAQLPENQALAGGALSLDSQTVDQFDAIVFGEKKVNTWMAGSSSFSRSADETDAMLTETTVGDTVKLAITYADNGANGAHITLYRNDAKAITYDKGTLATWTQADAEVIFGARHTINGQPRGELNGTIVAAQIYNVPLCASAIAKATPTGQ